MRSSFDISVSVLTVFAQGLLGFLFPCILPLLPLYLNYLAGEGKYIGGDERVYYLRRQVFIDVLLFVIGIGFTFFLLGFGFTALGKFFNPNRIIFTRISGIIVVMSRLYQFGFFGSSKILGKEHRVSLKLDRWPIGPIPALLLSFTFSFVWTPCAGPVLSSVMLMAGATSSMGEAAMLIGVYTLGFTLPFLAAGLFATILLDFFKKRGNAVKCMIKVGTVLLILMSIMTFTDLMNNFTGYLSSPGGFSSDNSTAKEQTTAAVETSPIDEKNTETMPVQSEDADDTKVSIVAAKSSSAAEGTTTAAPVLVPDSTLVDQNGETRILSDYQGKTVFLNFWATWCPPCHEEMPEIQALYEWCGSDEEDLIVLGVVESNQGQEGDMDYITSFLSEQGYTFPIMVGETGDVFYNCSICSYSTTFMVGKDGNIFGYASGALSIDMMGNIVRQTMGGKLAPQ